MFVRKSKYDEANLSAHRWQEKYFDLKNAHGGIIEKLKSQKNHSPEAFAEACEKFKADCALTYQACIADQRKTILEQSHKIMEIEHQAAGMYALLQQLRSPEKKKTTAKKAKKRK